MKLIAIVATTENNVIGIKNKMPWHLPKDLKFFKKTTLKHPVIMGKNTWTSLGRPLPNRENIVISRTLNRAPEGTTLCTSIKEAIQHCKEQNEKQAFIIGGGNIYQQTISLIDELYLTRIHTEIEGGEVFFPTFNTDEWERVWSESHSKDEQHKYNFTFEHWVKRVN